MSVVRGGAGGILVRLELYDGGSVKWRNVPDLEHRTLCRAFGLSEVHTQFDVPSSFRGVGSNQAGYGGSSSGRDISGYVLFNREPIGKIVLCREGEKIHDTDPTNKSDFYKL